MDFSTALEYLKEGKWVRMDTWPAGEAMVLMRNEGRTWFAVVSKDGYADYYTLSTQEILADTWVLCKTRKIRA